MLVNAKTKILNAMRSGAYNEHVRKIVTMGHDNTSSSKKELKSSNYLV